MSRISRSIALSERHAHITKGARQLHASGSATCGSASRPLPPEAVDQPGVLLETIQNAPRSGEVCTDPGHPTTGFVVRQYPHFGGLVRASSSCIPTRWSPRRMQSLATPFHHRCSPAPTKSSSETASVYTPPLLLRAVYGSSEKASALQHFRQLSEGFLLWPRGHRRHRTIVAETVVAIVRGVSSANASVHPTHGAERVDGNGALLWQLCADMSR